MPPEGRRRVALMQIFLRGLGEVSADGEFCRDLLSPTSGVPLAF